MKKQEILKIFQLDIKDIGNYEKYEANYSQEIDGVHGKDFVRAELHQLSG